jgi:NitT/TauT family transport system substrate-binding protein
MSHASRLTRSAWLQSAIAASALVPLAAGRAGAQTGPLPIRIAGSRNEGSGALYYAADQGDFERAGLAADIQTLQNGAAIAAAVAGGTIDVGASSPFVFMNARRHGLPVTLIGPGLMYDTSRTTVAMTVAPTSPYRTTKDLNGKVIGGITVGALDQLAANAWMDQNGGDSKSIQFIEISLSTMADALEQGRIAAAVMQDPQLTAALPRVRIIGKPYDAIARRFMISVWFTTNDFAAKNPVAVKKFGEAIAAGAQWGNANPERAAASIEKWTKIQEATVTSIAGDKLDPSLIQPICDAALKYHMIDAPMNARDFIWQG